MHLGMWLISVETSIKGWVLSMTLRPGIVIYVLQANCKSLSQRLQIRQMRYHCQLETDIKCTGVKVILYNRELNKFLIYPNTWVNTDNMATTEVLVSKDILQSTENKETLVTTETIDTPGDFRYTGHNRHICNYKDSDKYRDTWWVQRQWWIQRHLWL